MAAILTLLLRPRFHQVRCLGYSSVSAIFSRELAEQSVEWMNSCTLGKDVFGRLSWHSAKQLREELLDVLRRCKVNKAMVLLSLFKRNVDINKLIFSPEDVPSNDPVREDVQKLIDQLKIEDENSILDRVKMFMPGRILYIEKTHSVSQHACFPWNKSKGSFTFKWILKRDEIQHIEVSSRMIRDHMSVLLSPYKPTNIN